MKDAKFCLLVTSRPHSMSNAEQLGPRYQSAVKDAQGRFTAPHRDNVAMLPNSIIDYNFTPHQAIGDLGGTGHVVCIDLKAGFDMVWGDVPGLRTSLAVYLECFAITRYASWGSSPAPSTTCLWCEVALLHLTSAVTLSTRHPVVDYMDNACLAIRTIIDI
ncbi:unnamed protein product [Clavelina lepadiformis]|uniref:Uncharacterized protein n=1 Tax=Clavelina lepadiformis TaxID=159417 RepID=A0ABP0FSM6_CLALP